MSDNSLHYCSECERYNHVHEYCSLTMHRTTYPFEYACSLFKITPEARDIGEEARRLQQEKEEK